MRIPAEAVPKRRGADVGEAGIGSAADIAGQVMEATSLSQLTLPEVRGLAARIPADERNAMAPMPRTRNPHSPGGS